MMKIGVRGHDFGAKSPEELAELYGALGVETVQLAIPKAVAGVESYAAVTDRLLARIADSFRAGGIGVAVLGCYIEPALPDRAAREAQLAVFERGAYCAGALGAGCVATETTAYSGGEDGRARQFDDLCRSLDAMMAMAQRHGARLAVEPVAFHTMNTPRLARRVMRMFEGIGAIFDPVNLLAPELCGAQAQDGLWREAIECFGPETLAMHVKDVKLKAGGAAGAAEAGTGDAGKGAAASELGAGGAGDAGARLEDCLLGDGLVDYAARIAPWLKEQKKDMALLREGAARDTAERDLGYMRQTFC
jgi:sugar phosphate isomerase/epimerase